MDAHVDWQERLTFTGTADSGFDVRLGGAKDVGGDEDGLRPMELMLLSLAGCTAMDVISILRKKRQEVTSFRVHVHGDRAEDHPKVFTDLHVRYLITGRQIEPAAVERAIALSQTTYCPAQAMLSRAARITHEYEIRETDQSGAPTRPST
jgi:putative redox protein